MMMMTDAQLVPHSFQLSHTLPSLSTSWSLLNESGSDESAPSRTTPFPTTHHVLHADLSDTSDPALCVTPERTLSSHIPLPMPGICEDDCEPNHRATKVHFDQTVSVHHLSPEYGNNDESPDNYRLSELNLDVLSSVCNDLDTSYTEPISVIASDLRHLSPNSLSLLSELHSSRSLQLNSLASKNLASDSMRKKKSKSNSQLSMHIVRDAGYTGGNLVDSTPNCGQDDGLNAEPESVLAKPEFNSTLKISDEIAQLQEQQFDLVAVTKEKINLKLKQQVFEKACLKVNPGTLMYPDLISLEVSESDVLSRAADEQSCHLRPTDAASAADKIKPEEKISRAPDVLDFFTADLQKESPSVNIVGIPSFHLSLQTADLDRAFDLYRHIRTWDNV